jgi:hypothetical protein
MGRAALGALLLALVLLASAVAGDRWTSDAVAHEGAAAMLSDLMIVGQTVTAIDPNGPPLIRDDGYDNDDDTLTDEDGAGDCDGDTNADDDGDTAVDEDGGDCPIIGIVKWLHNNGPYATPYVISGSLTATDPAGVPLPCTFTQLFSDALSGSLGVGGSVTHNESWVMDCPRLGFGVDDDGDSPEQPCDGAYNLGLRQCVNGVDEDPPGGGDDDGDTLVDEDGPVSVEIVVVDSDIAVDDPSIIDPDLSNNTDIDSSLTLTSELPFAPTFTANQDDAGPDTFPHPAPSTDCAINLPCKIAFDYAIPGGNPLASTVLAVPAGAYTLSRASNYALVARVSSLTTIGPLGFTCGAAVRPFTVALANAALPLPGSGDDLLLGGVGTAAGALPGQLPNNATDGADADGDTAKDEDPPNDFPASGTDNDGDTRIDEDDATALANLMSWSSHLSAQVLAVTAGNADATLIARYAGLRVLPEDPAVNVLVFFDPTLGVYLQVPVVGDPNPDGDLLIAAIDPDDDNDGIPDFSDVDDDNNFRADTLETKQCSPLTVTYIQLGRSAANWFPSGPLGAGGEAIITCNQVTIPPGHTFPAFFTRADTGTTVTLQQQLTCSGIGSTQTPTATPPGVGGVVEVRAGGRAPPTTSSSPQTGDYTMAVAAVATSVLALAAAGWYARRRFSRR